MGALVGVAVGFFVGIRDGDTLDGANVGAVGCTEGARVDGRGEGRYVGTRVRIVGRTLGVLETDGRPVG